MREILPGVFHWTTFHEGISARVHSYLVTAVDPAVLIDPRVPDEGLDWFRSRAAPAHVYLTNRHHYRHSGRFAEGFGTSVWCHRAGLHEFVKGEGVRPFEHGDELPGGVMALAIGALCPEETAFLIPCEGGIVALGDSVIRSRGSLAFVPDVYMEEDPEGVKKGLRESLDRLLERDFRHLLLAHGEPAVGEGKEELRDFVASIKGDRR